MPFANHCPIKYSCESSDFFSLAMRDFASVADSTTMVTHNNNAMIKTTYRALRYVRYAGSLPCMVVSSIAALDR